MQFGYHRVASIGIHHTHQRINASRFVLRMRPALAMTELEHLAPEAMPFLQDP